MVWVMLCLSDVLAYKLDTLYLFFDKKSKNNRKKIGFQWIAYIDLFGDIFNAWHLPERASLKHSWKIAIVQSSNSICTLCLDIFHASIATAQFNLSLGSSTHTYTIHVYIYGGALMLYAIAGVYACPLATQILRIFAVKIKQAYTILMMAVYVPHNNHPDTLRFNEF